MLYRGLGTAFGGGVSGECELAGGNGVVLWFCIVIPAVCLKFIIRQTDRCVILCRLTESVSIEMIHANLQRQDLEIAGEALSHYYYDEEKRFALLHTKPCDPNLLGVISDMVELCGNC